ncbi:MAG: tyrosine-type recombinase/integrase [Streptosporangiaceae bacterium]
MTGTLRQAAAGYLQTRRSLGYQLEAHGRLLMNYIANLEASGQATVTAANAVAWATRPTRASAVWHSRRLSVARCFARYLSVTDRSCQVPPAWLLPARYSRTPPYIYTQQQIDALIHAAGTLGSPLLAASCQAVISLLATTGMRIGEALALTRANADLDHGIITVIHGKHGASRHVPLHPTVTAMLRRYAGRRDRLCPAPRSDRFFLTRAGTPLSPGQLQDAFARLLAHAGITVPAGQRSPRIHDLRHAFAVMTIRDWYRDGTDVQARLPVLSTMLGHIAPAHTYWYLTATPDLLALAAQRLHDHLGDLP